VGENRSPGDSGPGGQELDGQTGDEGFLSRWSRLKRESREGAAPVAAEPAAEPAPAPASDAEPPAEPPGDEDMPPLESLGPDSDYSAFMSPRVSGGLRQKALRQLFRSKKFNITDGLDVYAEDYTKFTPLGDVMTADLKFRLERKLKEALAKAEQAEEGEASAALEGQAEPSDEQAQESGQTGERSAGLPEDDDEPKDA
jgi:hypothetical protein